jgi:hypothetical protein
MNEKLQQLEDELKKEQWAKWLSYRRRSVDMTDDEQKIEVAQRVIAMPSFGWHQSWYEHLWAARYGTNEATGSPGAVKVKD